MNDDTREIIREFVYNKGMFITETYFTDALELCEDLIEHLQSLEQPKESVEEHRKMLNILEKKLGSTFYETGHLHLSITDAMEEYAAQQKSINYPSDEEIKEFTEIGRAHV